MSLKALSNNNNNQINRQLNNDDYILFKYKKPLINKTQLITSIELIDIRQFNLNSLIKLNIHNDNNIQFVLTPQSNVSIYLCYIAHDVFLLNINKPN